MDEAFLTRILKAVIKEENLATQSDVEALHEKMHKHEQRFEDIARRLQELERKMLQLPKMLRTSTGNRSTTHGTSNSSQDGWTLRLVHIRGFAPFGCGPADKLRKQELQVVQTPILSVCDNDLRQCLTPLGGFALNHNMSFKVDNSMCARDVSNRLD